MIKVYEKSIKDKPFFYLTDQVSLDGGYKKIQVYLGKNIPKDLSGFYDKLAEKEKLLVLDDLENNFESTLGLELKQVEKVEKTRIFQKYFFAQLTDFQKEKFWREFAIEFIFQSNAIEGSRLSQAEVKKIIKKKYIKKSLNRQEVIEVQNSIKAFDFIRSDEFCLNHKNIKKLHAIITKDLDIETGYKKREIIVNNKKTIPAQEVSLHMANLILHYKNEKKRKNHSFFSAIDFHAKFEFIHPFADGNGRTGRMILVWMLQRVGYGFLIFRLQNRQKYFRALDHADSDNMSKIYWFATEVYERTIQMDFFKK